MDHSLLPFAIILSILLCGCAPLCSSKRQRAQRVRPASQTQLGTGFAKDAPAARIPVRPGDIIFISVPNYLFRKVSTATLCPANHVGIVFHDPKRGWLVAESAVPVSRYTPLEKFIARSHGGWCEIRRLKAGITEAQVEALRAECDARMGVVYHTGFRYESRRQFCSKFVYDVYQSALGIQVGELETFSHLLDRNPEAGLGFWRVWFFGQIPWSRLTVTPASQFESGLLKTVWRNRTGHR
ncbi:MAG: YebB family permuted papain-like enzyme [Chthoniobacteraceae bacterium]|nr:YebB family permuted papain-like enzyme [Chthoniobacteraceae bacterium]